MVGLTNTDLLKKLQKCASYKWLNISCKLITPLYINTYIYKHTHKNTEGDRSILRIVRVQKLLINQTTKRSQLQFNFEAILELGQNRIIRIRHDIVMRLKRFGYA